MKDGLKRIINGLEDKALVVFGSLRELNLKNVVVSETEPKSTALFSLSTIYMQTLLSMETKLLFKEPTTRLWPG